VYSKLCPRSAVGTGVSGILEIFRLWVADIRASQSHEQVTRNAYVPETKEQDAEGFMICVLILIIGQSCYTDCIPL